jgi:hypothetical protein
VDLWMAGAGARRLTIRCRPPPFVYNQWVGAAAAPVDGSGHGRSKVERNRSDPFRGGLEDVSGALKVLVMGQVIHIASVFSTAFPQLSTAMGKDPGVSVGEAGRIEPVVLP